MGGGKDPRKLPHRRVRQSDAAGRFLQRQCDPGYDQWIPERRRTVASVLLLRPGRDGCAVDTPATRHGHPGEPEGRQLGRDHDPVFPETRHRSRGACGGGAGGELLFCRRFLRGHYLVWWVRVKC